jgi:hypothetical protein
MKMKYMIKRNSTILIGFITALVLLAAILPAMVSAAAVTASLSPSTGSVQQGNTFTVTVNLSTGSATILDAFGRVNFNTSQLQFVSASYGISSTRGSQGPSAALEGSYYIFDFTSTSNPSGNFGIVQITFKALASSGASSITLSNVEVSDGDTLPLPPNFNPVLHTVSVQNTSVTLTAPPEAPAAPPPTTPSAPASSPTTPKSTTTTAPKTQPTINYTVSPTPTPTAEEQATNSSLDDEQPILVTDFKDLTGYPVEIKILDKDGVPKPDVEVTLADKKSITDKNGIALFYGVVAGEYTVTADGVESTVTVSAGEPSIPQAYELTQTAKSSNIPIIIGIATVVILTVAGVLLYKNRSALKKNNNIYTPPSNTSTAAQTQEKTPTAETENYLKPNPPTAETIIHPSNKDINN